MTTPVPCRALYVHVPFCRTLCGYCDFYSELLDADRAADYVDALCRELETAADALAPDADTVFIGGGTPTVLPAPVLARLLAAVAAHVAPGAGTEFTVEANPATVTPETARLLADHGVNRVSIGAQSFSRADLRILDRRHEPEQVAQTVAHCRAAGITHISLDLIFGVPGQSLASWDASLACALQLEPEHLSCYGLTYEADTPLTVRRDAGTVTPVDEDEELRMFEWTRQRLAAAGILQYEISNYARPGAECRHNLRYWYNEPYVGVGPAAAGFVAGTRYLNVPDTAQYVARIRQGETPRVEEEQLTGTRRLGEAAMLQLRLIRGIDRARFQARYGCDPAEFFSPVIAARVADSLLVVDAHAIRLTANGLALADTVMRDFVQYAG